MKKKNKLFWSFATSLLLVGVVLVSCGPEEEEEFDVSWLLEKLTTTEFAQTGTLNIYGGTEGNTSDSVIIDIESVWDGEFFFLEHTYYNEDGTTETANTRVYKDSDGLTVSRYLNYDNTYIDYPYYNEEYEEVYFDDEYNNPFKNATIDDFEVFSTLDSSTSLSLTVKEEYVSYLSYFLTGYQDIPLVTISFEVDEDLTISGVMTFYEEYEDEGVNKYSGGLYEFTLVSQDSIETGKVTQFELTEEHEVLSTTLAKLSEHNFTMSVTQIGSLINAQYETLETSNASLMTNDVNSNYISSRTYTGYYQDENGLHSVESNGYDLVADDYPTDGSLSSMRSNFGLSAALFDVVDENTFVLKEGYESYAMYGAVDYRYNLTRLDDIVAGTYTIKILNDSVEITYDYISDYGYSGIDVVTITIVLTNIGTTSVDDIFNFIAYEEPTGEGWDSLGSSITDILKKYYDDKYNTILPFFDYTVYSGTLTEETGGYGRIYFLDSSNGGEATLAAYCTQLEQYGWTLVEVDDEGESKYHYPLDNGNGYYHIGVKPTSNGKYNYIFFYEKGGTLEDYLNGKYGSTINSTVSITQETTYYYYDNQEKGDVFSGPTTTMTATYQFLDDCVFKTQTTSSTSIMYFVPYDDETIYIYQYSSYYEEWSLLTSSSGTIETYLNYGTYPPTALVPYASFFSYRSGTDAIYDVSGSFSINVAQYVFGVYASTVSSAISTVTNLEIDYFNNEFTISLTLQRTSGSYLIEDVYTATYSNFGSTKITRSDLPDPSQFQ